MQIELDTLRAFSASLMALSRIAPSAAAQDVVREALLALRPVVGFRSAWWGECSDAQGHRPPRNWLHGRINLSDSFAQEWNGLAAGDVFALDSMRRLGTVVRVSGYNDPVPEVDAFSRRHRLFHVMAVTAELPGSGLMFFVSLYRDEHETGFSDEQAALFGEFNAHLLQHWHRRVHALVLDAALQSSDAFALVDPQGRLVYLGGALGQVLAQADPHWSGTELPADLARMLTGGAAMTLGRRRLSVQTCGELRVVALDQGGRAGLPPRERSAAVLYAQGHSYKEIARLLGLSPATVRTYLRSAYAHFGVSNKIELGSALRVAARA